ncbi:MAG: EthD domain-containing protein [Nitrososphaerota archaeon]|nr:EthD domain-containing protein [Nitrososphaerota archaeon]
MSREEFKNHWLNKHAEVVKTFPEIKKYTINCVIGSESEYDGVSELWFNDEISMRKLDSSERFKQFVKDDNPKFQDLNKRWSSTVEEITVV